MAALNLAVSVSAKVSAPLPDEVLRSASAVVRMPSSMGRVVCAALSALCLASTRGEAGEVDASLLADRIQQGSLLERFLAARLLAEELHESRTSL